MQLIRARVTRPLVIAAVLASTLGAAAGVTAVNGGFTGETSSASSDTVQPAAAEAKQMPPDCNTGWKQYKPRKNFMWNKTTGWFRVGETNVRFRSGTGEFFYRYDHRCKRIEGWRGYASSYQTIAKGPEAKIPKASPWYPANESCGTTNEMNVIIGCYRGQFRYQEVNNPPTR
ncbi:hypothetical protein ABZ079_29620 [Streptomyces sp. NPDC006314]|uniref:hypothetical protein n=1 Tax=Streptomyces sp. NPDC006314 TaxID=3154475 RepID=UPI0033B724D6